MELVNVVDCSNELNKKIPQLMMLEVKKILDLKGISYDRMLYECNSFKAWIWKYPTVVKNTVA